MKGTEEEIVGRSVIMRPYLRQFVERYHTWMEDSVLRELTASEPLSLEEEYAMQKSWIEDEKKCTFILFDRGLPNGLQGMCGDVNLYLNDLDDPHTAEIEIMIAEPGSRRKGIAKEALQLMLNHGHSRLGIMRFVAKIGADNSPSRRLFEALGFHEAYHSEVFREHVYKWDVNDVSGGASLGMCQTMHYQALSI